MHNNNQDQRNKALVVDNTRKQLSVFNFDSNSFLTSKIESIPIDTVDPERNLLQLFEHMAADVTLLSQDIEGKVEKLQKKALNTESLMVDELEANSSKLSVVSNAVDEVKLSFDLASVDAVKVGGRLASSERERNLIEKSIELIGYIKAFESTSSDFYDELANNPVQGLSKAKRIRSYLPSGLQNENWGTISQVLHDLRKILFDIKAEDVQNAQRNIIKVTDMMEIELLEEFDKTMSNLMTSMEDPKLLRSARELTGWLHLYDYGQAVQKRYIFSVVQQRIPNSSGGRSPKRGNGEDSNRMSFVGSALMDHLSKLFSVINKVCREQFELVCTVFPAHTIARVTRLLVQRIFNDPAFGIQARVDAILCPTPPLPPLGLADYLDALVTVREKLSALYVLLLECCSHPLMRGMGSESASLKRAKYAVGYRYYQSGYGSGRGTGLNGSFYETKFSNGNMLYGKNNETLLEYGEKGEKGDFRDPFSEFQLLDADEEAEERLRSDAEIRSFFDDQITQVLGRYVSDYFHKEDLHVRNQFRELITKSFPDPTFYVLKTSVSSDLNHQNSAQDSDNPYHKKSKSVESLPVLRSEKLKTLELIITSVANRNFINQIFLISTDTLMRMESIGRDDKQLPIKTKELFLLLLGFLSTSVLLPCCKAVSSILLKNFSSRVFTSSLPPMEVLEVLSAVSYGVHKLKIHFDEVFTRPLSVLPNVLAICKENRRKVFRKLDIAARECLYAWTLCISGHLQKLLQSLQSKYDYMPKTEYGGMGSQGTGLERTLACDSVCKELLLVISNIRAHEAEMLGLDLIRLFWKPLGQLLVGSLISHLKRQKISIEGSKVLMKDLKEYSKVIIATDCVESADLSSCLLHLAEIFTVPPSMVAKVVTEDLRYLSTEVVLALLIARSDSNPRSAPEDHWTHILGAIYGPIKTWQTTLPWENNKPLTVDSFGDLVSSTGSRGSDQLMGPTTLRRSAVPVTQLFMTEVARAKVLTASQLTANGQTVSIDLSKVDESDGLDNIPVQALQASPSPVHGKYFSGFSDKTDRNSHFLPNRPDALLINSKNEETKVYRPVSVGRKGSGIVRPDLIKTSDLSAFTTQNFNNRMDNDSFDNSTHSLNERPPSGVNNGDNKHGVNETSLKGIGYQTGKHEKNYEGLIFGDNKNNNEVEVKQKTSKKMFSKVANFFSK